MEKNYDKANKKVIKNGWNTSGIKLIALVVFVISYSLYKLITGQISTENINIHNNYYAKDTNIFRSILEFLVNKKETFITFSILIVIIIFLRKSNADWENKNLNNQDQKELETIQEENEDNMDNLDD